MNDQGVLVAGHDFGVLASNVAAPSLHNEIEDGGGAAGTFRAYRIVLEAPP